MEKNLVNDVLLTSLKIQHGKVVSIDPDGVINVKCCDNEFSITCEFLQTSNEALPPLKEGDAVLIGIYNEIVTQGFILGVLKRYIPNNSNLKHELLIKEIEGHKSIKLNVEEKIEIKCGKSSFIMDKNGKIVIKGANITTRASGVNKVKGAAVSIN